MEINRLKNILENNPDLIISVWEEIRTIEIDENGEWVEYSFDPKQWVVVIGMIKQEIRTRPDPSKRFEYWECSNMEGEFSPKLLEALLKERKRYKPRLSKGINKRALKQLTDAYKIPPYMAELFLSEIKLTNPECQKNKILLQRAKLLELL